MIYRRYVRVALIGAAGAIALILGTVSPASAAPGGTANTTPAAIQLSPTTGPVGTLVTVDGSRFPKNSAGMLTAGESRVAFSTLTNGTFRAAVVIPATTSASILVTASAGGLAASKVFTVIYNPATASPPATATPVPFSSARLRFGVTTPGGAQANAELDAVATMVNENPSIVLSYKDFTQAPPIADLDSVYARGATSLITWEPWKWGGGTTQSAFTSDAIAAGTHDSYLTEWGTALASWGKPVMLRYAHEMNGDWYPWADGVNGNQAGDFVTAWRHVHDVVARTGATNVTWVWSPNVPYTGSTALSALYPGPGYVGLVALDGYNWGTTASWSTWTEPSALFSPGLTQLRSIAPGKNIIIAETGSAEVGGSKASWNSALVSYLAAQPDVTAFVWFHHNKEADWRIDSSASSATALRAALGARNG